MYAGKVVEEAPVGELFRAPRHPYTQGLIRSIPRIDMAAAQKQRARDDRAAWCRACSIRRRAAASLRAARYARAACTAATPPLREIGSGHKVACVLP